jgi:heat shock protein HslJ
MTGRSSVRCSGRQAQPRARTALVAALLSLGLLPVWEPASAQTSPPGQRPPTLGAPTSPGVDPSSRVRPQPPSPRAAFGPAQTSLEGGVWQLRAYRTELGLKPTVAGEGNSYVAFDDGGFQINAGCDTLRGSYWLEGERLLFSPHVASVVGDCPPTLRAQEQAVLALLPAVTRLRRADGELLLLGADQEPLLSLTAPDKSPLQRRLWLLLAYRDRNDLIVPALPAPTFTLRFEDAANLSGVACDKYRGGFIRDERFLQMEGPIAASRLGCADPVAARQAEDYLDALSRVDSYRVDAQSLLLRDADGRMIARFTAIDLPSEEQEPGIADANPLPSAPLPLPPAPGRDARIGVQPGAASTRPSGPQ